MPRERRSKYANDAVDNAQLASSLAEIENNGFPLNVVGNLKENLNEWLFDSNERLHLISYGDSITAGAWGDPTETNWYKTGWAGRLHAILKRIYGDGGRGFIGLWDKAWTKTGTWTNNADFAPWGYCYFASTSASTYTLNNVYGDIVEIYYVNNASMTFSYSVDGGAPVEVSASSPFQNQISKTVVNLGTLGTHTIQINGATVGNLFLVGASVYTGTKGLVIHNLALSSMTAYLAQFKIETRFDVVETHFPPKLSFLNFLANDFVYQDSSNNFLSTYESHMNTIAAKFKSIGSDLIVWQPPKGTKAPLANTWTKEEYYAKSKSVAVVNNAVWLDFWTHWGENNLDKMYDSEHPNTKGHKEIALTFLKLLK
jgi:lysophospholipase L1-like esterase